MPSSVVSPVPDPTLDAERGHLADARQQLTRMRQRTEALDAKSGDAVSAAFLASALYHRALSLQDDQTSPLFFGRIDVSGGATPGRWYVGRRHIHDDHGDPVVVDWRADVSRAFYRATRLEPMGVTLRRRFGFERGDPDGVRGRAPCRPVRGRPAQRDPGQRDRATPHRADARHRRDDPARAGRRRPRPTSRPASACRARPAPARRRWACTAPPGCSTRTGTGCAAAASSWSARTGRSCPTSAQVLPALGEVEVSQTTVDELVGQAVPVRAVDPVDVAVLKGDARMAQVLQPARCGHRCGHRGRRSS